MAGVTAGTTASGFPLQTPDSRCHQMRNRVVTNCATAARFWPRPYPKALRPRGRSDVGGTLQTLGIDVGGTLERRRPGSVGASKRHSPPLTGIHPYIYVGTQ